MSDLTDGRTEFERGNFAAAMALLLPLAKSGIAEAQLLVASIYHFGPNEIINGRFAEEWYVKAAEQSERHNNISGIAYHNLATMLTTGLPGFSADKSRATDCLRKASELGVELVPKSWWKSDNNG